MHISKIKKRKRHIVLKVLAVLLLIILAAVIFIAVRYKDNIKAFIVSRTQSSEAISNSITESKQELQEAIDQYDLPITRDFTFEEEEKIRKGELSVEDAMQLIMKPSETTENTDSNNNTDNNVSDNTTKTKPQKNNADSIVAKYVQQVYGLKAYYIGELGRVEGEMRAVYVQSGRDKTKIAGIVQSYLPQIGTLEGECDNKISALLSQMRAELSAIGADTAITDKIYDAYINEKALRKAYYLSMY